MSVYTDCMGAKKILKDLMQQQASNSSAIDLQNNPLFGLNIRFNFTDEYALNNRNDVGPSFQG